ncbi:CLUMA_CG019055, isoform A [Clunio marinus]|uniref:phenylalanine--tRNA ligase n=1 Tax=Clunio marinus TaxID=568069 RepID=A0A1J1J0D7_9DIPT|nr:CLUMA_CG019055, isoform A [Clunio marinus]
MQPELTEQILNYIEQNDLADTLDLATNFNEDHQKIIGAVKSIQAHGELLNTETSSRKWWPVTDEGQYVIENGSHEASIFNAIPSDGISQADLMKTSPNAKVGFSKAMSQGWIVIDKSAGKPIVRRKVDSIDDIVQQHLIELKCGKGENIPDNIKNDYKKRKLMVENVTRSYVISKGAKFSTTLTKLETDLTSDMLLSGAWKNLKFKDYNFDAMGAQPASGHLHPLLKVRSEVADIFVQMGFQEMPTNNYVESSFWNFDALFQPQQHPARDAQDTFFITNPQLSTKFPTEYLQRVKKSHEEGGNGSIGYRYDWSLNDAQKNVLRTHTTAVSARMLYKLANQEGGFKPTKYFSIDKVFRNETLDATHLAEFHQVEGVIAGVDITLGDLMGIIGGFFAKMGLTDIEFKPAYNPYTEPSMEIFAFHKVEVDQVISITGCCIYT